MTDTASSVSRAGRSARDTRISQASAPMHRGVHTLAISARSLSSRGALLTINDDRRVEVGESITTIRSVLNSQASSEGFLGALANLVGRTERRAADAQRAVRRVWVQADPGICDGVGKALLEEFCRSSGRSSTVVVDRSLPSDLDEADLLVTLHEGFDFERLALIEDAVHAHGARWAPFWQDAGGARFGPFQAGPGPTIRDLAKRWITASAKESHGRALLVPPDAVVAAPPMTGLERAFEIAVFLHDVGIWTAGGHPRAWWHTVRLDRNGEVTTDPVLPMPDRGDRTSPRESRLTPLSVVNTRTGIVTRLRDVEFRLPMPPGVRYVESQTADMARLGPWASNIYNAGSSWGDDDLARLGAVGEAIERYCGNLVDDTRLLFGSFDELTRRGARVLDPRELVLFAHEQYSDPRFPFLPLDRGTRTHWIAGRSLVDDEEILVPAALTFVNWNTGRSLMSPRTNPAYYPGIAAGTTLEGALANAMEEVVERDAAMVWWWSGHRLPTAQDADGVLERLMPADWCAEYDVHARVTPLTNAVGLPAVAVSVDASRQGLLTVGFAARHSAEAATEKALLEALGLLETAVDMHDPEGGFWTTHSTATGNTAVRPVRQDRRYLDSYRSDFRDVTDLFCQLQIQLDPRSHRVVKKRIGESDARTTLAGLPRFHRRSPYEYTTALADAGFEPLAVHLTTADVAAAGWHVVRVIVPGLVPNFPTAFPPLGRGRLQELPTSLGWREKPIPSSELYSFPMPYA